MAATTLSDAQIDLYLDGMARGMELAEMYQERCTCPPRRIYLGRLTRNLVRVLLVVSITGYIVGGLQMAGVI